MTSERVNNRVLVHSLLIIVIGDGGVMIEEELDGHLSHRNQERAAHATDSMSQFYRAVQRKS